MTIKQPSWFTFKQINTIKDYEILDTGKREYNIQPTKCILMANMRISEDTHQQLSSLKQQYNCKSIDAVIQHLLHINKKYETGKVVMLIE